jgi:hypothetical protein|tara:strand:+ start:1345 stop:1965 length:621 start_codon:yes stop_codon:yes gene_type:complete
MSRYRVQHEPQRTERHVELLVLLLGLLLLLQLAFFLLRVLLPPSPEPIEPTAASLTVADRIAGRLLDTRGSAELRERPLFWEGRRPVDDSAVSDGEASTQKASQLKGIRLLGIYGGGESGGIIVRVEGKQQRLAVGDELRGWKLESMDGSGATLSSARGGRERLELERVQGAASISVPVQTGDSPGKAAQTEAADGLDELTLGGRR